MAGISELKARAAAALAKVTALRGDVAVEGKKLYRTWRTRLGRRMGGHQIKKTPTLRALYAWSRPA